jgi:hypothetical protein
MSDSELQGIHSLLASYGVLLDRQLVEPWLDLFTQASVLDVAGDLLRTRPEREHLATTAPRGLHLANLPVITGNPQTGGVTSLSTFMFWNTRKGKALTGWYEDELRRNGKKWQFVSRRISYLDDVAFGPSNATRD